MGRLDVESFLQNGYWQNTRATSPEPSFYNTSAPVRTAYVDPAAPRRLPFRVEKPRQQPPPPSVEDEIQSLAREHGSPVSTVPDEEPSNRGEVEQYPILLEVHEHNPERRFVIVPGSSEPSSDDSSGTEKRKIHHRRTKSSVPRTETYEANTGRKYDTYAPSSRSRGSDKKYEEVPSRDKRRSKLDGLPAIVTDSSPVDDARSRNIRKARSTTAVEHTGEDYFSPKESSRSHVESMLSPDVIKHSTRGKDRPYWDGGSSPNAHRAINRPGYLNDQRRSAYEPRDFRHSDNRHKSTSPTLERRSTLDLPTQTKRSSKDSYDTRARRDTETHSPRLERKDSSRSYARPQREPLSRRAASYRDSRDSPTFDSSEDEARRYGEVRRRRRRSLVRDDRRDYLETPVESSGKSKSRRSSRHPSPDPTLRGSQSPLYDRYGSSHSRSSTFPKESKTSSDEDRPERPLSRASTARSTISSAASIVIPAVISAATSVATDISSQSDRRKPDLPPPPPKHEIWPERSSTASTVSSAPSSSKPQQNWPPRFEPPPPPPPPHQQQPRQNGAQASSKPIISYRRYSEDVKSGAELPDLPECPRTREEAGHVDWLTFPRCDNFNVCPSCYSAAFAGTPEFAHSFVPAPFRPLDRPLACDFGRSPWYQVAWLLARKARMADLSLLRGVAAALARAPQPCDGFRESFRVWYSIPTASTTTVPGFTVCQACARAVEAVLPNLTGIFVPEGAPAPAEPRLGVCSMHHEGPSSSSRGEGGASCGDRFVAYLSAMETAADDAMAAGRAPDVQALADRIAHIAAVPECRRGAPVRDARWYIMRSMPEFTVCEACFGEVVAPLLVEQQQRGDERDGGPSIAGDFHYRPQRLPLAACQLYSGRMRDAFVRAARRRDPGLLESRFHERRAREQEYYSKVAALDRQRQHGYDPEWVAQEAERLLHEWQAGD